MIITESRLRRIIRSVLLESDKVEKKERVAAFVSRLGFDGNNWRNDTQFAKWFNSVNPDSNDGYDGRKSGFGGGGAIAGNAANSHWYKGWFDRAWDKVCKAYKNGGMNMMNDFDKFMEMDSNKWGGEGEAEVTVPNNQTFKNMLKFIIEEYKRYSVDSSRKAGYGEAGLDEMERSGVSIYVLITIIKSQQKMQNKFCKKF